MGWVISGSEVRRSMRMRRERDSRGGFARNDASTRRIAVGSWLEEQRRGMRRLIFVSSSGVRSICFVAETSATEAAESDEEEERVENRREIGFEGNEAREGAAKKRLRRSGFIPGLNGQSGNEWTFHDT